MKNILTVLLTAALTTCHLACAGQNENNTSNDKAMKKTLVAYFSRADENYGVGYVEKGNTQIVAEMIAEATGADTFHIRTVEPYPADYDACIAQAKTEMQQNARPDIVGDVGVEQYDTIFIGYPNWWGEPPMALYTFIERHAWEGRVVIPFITHEGSGFGGTDRRVAAACKGATALTGYAVQGRKAQRSQDDVRKAVAKWLEKL